MTMPIAGVMPPAIVRCTLAHQSLILTPIQARERLYGPHHLLVAESLSASDATWLSLMGIDGAPPGDQYMVSIYWAVLMVVGIGAFATATSTLGIVFRRWHQQRSDQLSERIHEKVESIDARLERIEDLLDALQPRR